MSNKYVQKALGTIPQWNKNIKDLWEAAKDFNQLEMMDGTQLEVMEQIVDYLWEDHDKCGDISASVGFQWGGYIESGWHHCQIIVHVDENGNYHCLMYEDIEVSSGHIPSEDKNYKTLDDAMYWVAEKLAPYLKA